MRHFLQTFLACLIIILTFTLYSCLSGPIYPDPYYSIADIRQPLLLKIGLSKFLNVPSAEISVNGSYIVKDESNLRMSTGFGIDDALVTYSNGTIKVGGETFTESTIVVSPLNDGTLEIDGIRYHGELIIYGLGKNKIALINKVELEKYLAGVVGKEMPLNSPEDALKAQIIAARTFAIYEHKTPPEKREEKAEAPKLRELFDVYDDQRSQVYGGMEKESYFTRGIVYQTRGDVLAYNGYLFRTYYASTCGGARAPAWDVFKDERQIPPLGGGKCDWCTSSKYYLWTATFTKKDLLATLVPSRKNRQLKRIRASKSAPSGHIIELSLEIAGEGEPFVINAYDVFRRNLNTSPLSSPTNNIRSTLFTIKDIGDSIEFHGKGWGHGVGLCQTGAIEMGRLGYTYSDILKYYYPQSQIVKIY